MIKNKLSWASFVWFLSWYLEVKERQKLSVIENNKKDPAFFEKL